MTLLNSREAAVHLGVAMTTVQKLAFEGRLRGAIRLGFGRGRWYFPPDVQLPADVKPRIPNGTPWRDRVVESETGCLVWQGSLDRYGYGQWSWGYSHLGTSKAHRVVYELERGPIPEGLQIDHLCRNCACVNPDHLEPVTNAENQRRAALARTHCKHGHEFSPENTFRQANGARGCIKCRRDDDARRRRQIQAAAS